MNLFNRGLSAFNYRYFIAEGKSALQLQKYGETVEATTQKIVLFVQKHNAHFAQMCAGEDVRVHALVFLNDIPKGWDPYLALGAVPDERLDAGMQNAVEMDTLCWPHPHDCLQAEMTYDEEGRALHVLAGRIEHGQWLIACPVGEDSYYFTPADAREITIKEYCIALHQIEMIVPPSPSDIAMFDHIEEKFPFTAKTEDSALFRKRFEEATTAALSDPPKEAPESSGFLKKIVRVFKGDNSANAA